MWDTLAFWLAIGMATIGSPLLGAIVTSHFARKRFERQIQDAERDSALQEKSQFVSALSAAQQAFSNQLIDERNTFAGLVKDQNKDMQQMRAELQELRSEERKLRERLEKLEAERQRDQELIESLKAERSMLRQQIELLKKQLKELKS